MSELDELRRTLPMVGTEPLILDDTRIAHVVAHGHRILSHRTVHGLRVELEETPDATIGKLIEHVLGLHVRHNYRDVWVEYDLGGSTFAITTTEMGHTPGAKGAVVAFEVSDLNAFLHKMKERAVSFVMEAFDTPVCRMAVIEDQDNNHITIHKRHT